MSNEARFHNSEAVFNIDLRRKILNCEDACKIVQNCSRSWFMISYGYIMRYGREDAHPSISKRLTGS